MIDSQRINLGRKKYLALAIPLLMSMQAQGAQFEFGEVSAKLDSQLSLGSSWRMEDPDSKIVNAPLQSTDDDGDRNYEKGDAFSQIFKGSHDLQLSYENFGLFLRGKYWYDQAMADNKVLHGHVPTATVNSATTSATDLQSGVNYQANQPLDDSNFDDLSKAQGATLLDAFAYAEFDVMDMPLDVRLGRQVVSWGESTFIIGGLNAINPADLSAFRRPGAELKEGLLPVGMAYANLGISDSLSAEVFYQYEYQNTVTDACGTFFSTSDVSAQGCNTLTVNGGALSLNRNDSLADAPADDNQYGAALRYFADAIETEFGLFAMNTHSRLPVYNVKADESSDYATLLGFVASAGFGGAILDPTDPANAPANLGLVDAVAQGAVKPQVDAGFLAADTGAGSTFEQAYDATYAANAGFTAAQKGTDIGNGLLGPDAAAAYNAALASATDAQKAGVVSMGRILGSNYTMSFPEDKQMIGMSFSSNVGGVALSGEVSHKMDSPVQINTSLLTAAVLARGVAPTANAEQVTAFSEVYNGASAGDLVKGYREFDITQAQVTAITTFNQVAGAGSVALVAEVGMQYVHGFDDDLKYGRASFYGAPSFDATDGGFATETSWGYRARISANYNNVFMGVDMVPVISWSHDVDGVSAGPGGPFDEGNQALGLSVKAKYQERYSATLAYTQYEGGDYSVNQDRDFASVSLDVQF